MTMRKCEIGNLSANYPKYFNSEFLNFFHFDLKINAIIADFYNWFNSKTKIVRKNTSHGQDLHKALYKQTE